MKMYRLKVLKTEKTRKVFHIKTPNGDFALKPTQMSEETIEFIQLVLSELSQRGFPVEPFILTDEGRNFSIFEGARFLLSPWFSGREANFDRLGDLMFGAKLLARLHQDSQGLSGESVPAERRRWGSWPRIFSNRIHQLESFQELSKSGRENFERIYHRFAPHFLFQAEESLANLSLSPYFFITAIESSHSYLCHHDFSGRNLLVNPVDCRLLDFDYCIADLRLHDVANLILRLLRHDEWQSGRASFALKIYHRQYPLTEEHLRVLHLFLCWPQDFWQLGLQYFIERLPWPMERFLRTLNKKIADEPARQRFLREFPKENGIIPFRKA